jgi:uncharacterized coiled-coil DUF342 family protein
MASTYEKFSELESRILKTVEMVKTLQKELAGSRAEAAKLRGEIDELRRERDLVKNKIESLLENLSELTEETLV